MLQSISIVPGGNNISQKLYFSNKTFVSYKNSTFEVTLESVELILTHRNSVMFIFKSHFHMHRKTGLYIHHR